MDRWMEGEKRWRDEMGGREGNATPQLRQGHAVPREHAVARVPEVVSQLLVQSLSHHLRSPTTRAADDGHHTCEGSRGNEGASTTAHSTHSSCVNIGAHAVTHTCTSIHGIASSY